MYFYVALPSIKEVVGADIPIPKPLTSLFITLVPLYITSSIYSAILRPPDADGSTLAT